jgi:hypothetical protein
MFENMLNINANGAAVLLACLVVFGGLQILARVQNSSADYLFSVTFARLAVVYLPWAALQQIILPLWQSADFFEPWQQCAAAAFTFAVGYHFPNKKLMILTGCFAVAVYPLFFLGLISWLHVATLHAVGGAAASLFGVDLRAWLSYWRRDGGR